MNNKGIFESYTDKICHFIRNNDESYILLGYKDNKLLTNQVFLRQMIFQNLFLCFACIDEDDQIKDLMICNLPGIGEDAQFLQIIYFSNQYDNFLFEGIEYFKNICNDEGFSKIKIALTNNDKKFENILYNIGFNREAQLTNLDTTITQYALFLDPLKKIKCMPIAKCVPTSKKTYYVNSKEDKDDSVLYSSIIPSRPYRLNKTGTFIFEQVQQEISIAEIVEIVSKKYNYFNYEKILDDALRVLKGLWENGYIHWKDSVHPYTQSYQANFNNYIFEEYSYENIIDFYNDANYLRFENPFMSKEVNQNTDQLYLNIIIKREKAFRLIENNEILVKLSLSYDSNTKSIIITNLIINDKFDILNIPISEFLEFCKKKLLEALKLKNTDQSIYLYIEQNISDKYKEKLNRLKFKYLSTLYFETKSGNVNLYVLN